jgi:nucleotide-binding universal stress UspA family protein
MSFTRILVTLDGSEFSETALPYAIAAAGPSAQVTLLMVMEEDWAATFAVASMTGHPAALAANPRKAIDSKAIADACFYLDTIAKKIRVEGITVNPIVRTGSVVETIREVAQNGYDLIVMATHGRTGLGRVILGSVVSDILPAAPCPVMVIPPVRPISDN